MRCEDFPCCGHEPGDCPDPAPRKGYSGFRCIYCRKPLKKGAPSSICSKCQQEIRRREEEWLGW